MKCLIFLAVVTMAFAELQKCDFNEESFSVIRRGARSTADDDAEAFSSCGKGETLVGCDCEAYEGRPDDCDGSMFRSTENEIRCIAKNSAVGKGVVAKSTCQKTVITCETTYTNMPQISCPDNYKLMFCNMHTHFSHTYEAKPIKPRVKRSGKICKTTKGCKDCKVGARCVRITNFGF